jgi:arsenate reductase-like glutaredoxin family protein
MKTLLTTTGRKLKISANHSKRAFTIVTDVVKYKTTRLSKEEFNSCLNNTGQDWQNFLKYSPDYYKVL